MKITEPLFAREIYVRRRQALKNTVKSGLLLFLGNEESPINYAANQYPFRQDSSFLSIWGLNSPALAAIIDIDEGTETLFGDDPTVAEIVWTGPQPLLRDRAEAVGAGQVQPMARLKEHLMATVQRGRAAHFLPPYRGENVLKIERLLGIHPAFAKEYASAQFTNAVVAQRSIKAHGGTPGNRAGYQHHRRNANSRHEDGARRIV